MEEIFYINERDDKLHVRDGKLSKKEWKQQFKGASAYGMYSKTDKRPYWRQYVKIPDRVKIKVRKIWHRIRDLLVKEEWNIAIRPRGDKLLFEDKNTEGFTVLKNRLRYWCADPFILTKDGKDYLFFEMYDRFKAKGVIGYEVIENGKVGKRHKAYEISTHLSFPNVFEHEGATYMMPESCGAGKLSVLKATHFPDQWQEEIVLLGRKVCDSVFLEEEDKVYLLTQPLDGEEAVLESYIVERGRAYACEGNPIVQGKKNSRMAGAIIQRDEKNIRVAQDCVMGYGLALNFHETSYAGGIFGEKDLARIEIGDMPQKQRKKYVGMHTYNISENYEVIDFKNKDRMRFGNIVNVFYRIVKKVVK